MNIFLSLSYLDPVNVTDNATLVQCPINLPLASWHPTSFNAVAKVSSILAITVKFVTMPFTVFLNALIIYVVLKNESLQVERVIVLAYLALADLLVGVVCQPLFIAKEVLQLQTNTKNCNIETVQHFFGYLFGPIAFNQLVLVTYERYVAIIHPYQYPTRITVKSLTCATIVLWAVITPLVVLYFVLLAVGAPNMWAFDLFLSLYNAVAVILMVYCYVRIFRVIRRQNRSVGQQQHNAGTNNQHTLQNHKGAITAALLLGCFLVSFIPLFSLFFLKLVLDGVVDISGSAYLSLQPWALTFVHLSSFVNPIIYGLRVGELRTKCLNFLRSNTTITPE